MEYRNPLQLIDHLFGQANDYLSNQLIISRPAVNVSETEDAYCIELAAPGLQKSDFDIDLSDGKLTISANKEPHTKKYTRREYSFSQFKRTFSIPTHVDTDKVSAKYENGILEIILPFKRKESKEVIRKVTID